MPFALRRTRRGPQLVETKSLLHIQVGGQEQYLRRDLQT